MDKEMSEETKQTISFYKYTETTLQPIPGKLF